MEHVQEVIDSNQLTVTIQIDGKDGVQGGVAAELVYEFKYNNQIDMLTDFTDSSVRIEFSIAPADYENVVRFVTRLKGHGLKVQTEIAPT